MREEKERADRAPRLHGERRREATETAGGLERQTQGDAVSTKPKTWDGKPAPKGGGRKKAAEVVHEPIPDEADDQGEQTTTAGEQ
jgi:hypothetical protein